MMSLIRPLMSLIRPLVSLIRPSISLTWPMTSLIQPATSLIQPLMSLLLPLMSLIQPLISLIWPSRSGRISDIPCHLFGQGASMEMIPLPNLKYHGTVFRYMKFTFWSRKYINYIKILCTGCFFYWFAPLTSHRFWSFYLFCLKFLGVKPNKICIKICHEWYQP